MAEDDDHNRRGDRVHLRNDGKKYDVTLKVMLAVIISLSVVVFLVILLHIYARWVLRRQARRRAAMRHLGLVLAHGPDSTELTPKTGLDPSVIALLPTFVFKQPDSARDNSSLATEAATSTAVAECAVCLNVLEDGEMVRVLPNCKHMFHVECINKWLGSHSTCPLCRAEAQPEPNEMSSEPSIPNAPPVERVDSSVSCVENAPDGAGRVPGKGSGSGSRLSSFRRILSRERSSRRIQIQPQDCVGEDVERQ